MKINIISGFDFHIECIGFLLESFKNHDITIYLRKDKFSYCDFFQTKICRFKVEYFSNLVLQDADLNIKLSSNDFCIDNENIVSILHLYSNKTKSKKYISLTPYIYDYDIINVFPCYTLHSVITNMSNTICYIGYFINSYLDEDTIKFIQTSNFNFKFMVWGDTSYKYLLQFQNVEILQDLKTEDMFSHIFNCKYVLSRKLPFQNQDRFSGALSVAVSALKPCILQETIANTYNIPCISFKDNYCETIDTIQNTSELQYRHLVKDIQEFRDESVRTNTHKLLNLLPKQKNTCLMIEPRKLTNIDTIFQNAYTILQDKWNYVFYCGKDLSSYWRKLLPSCIDIRELEVTNFDKPEYYSDFCKSSKLWNSIEGSYALIIQADTWIVESSMYTIDYFIQLDKSYIGSNMNFYWNEIVREKLFPQYPNFNGGLSLRKIEHMRKIIQEFPPKPTVQNSTNIYEDAEDVYFVLGCYNLNMPVGDDQASSHFSLHKIYKDDFFGIHQPCNSITLAISKKYPTLKERNPYLRL
jgi:hypothetical protein